MMAEIGLKDVVKQLPEIALRRTAPADLVQVLELVRTALGPGSVPRTEAFWRWKHEQNPFGPSPVMVADADGRIASLRVFLRWRWRYGGRTFAAVRPVDTATHPDWRRRGLFEWLTRELLQVMKAEGVAFVFNTPNAASGRGYEKLGWRIVGAPTIWVRPVRPVRVLSELALHDEPTGLAEAPQRFESATTDILTSPDLASFLRSTTRSAFHLMTDADAAYLAWRYHDCPGLAYGAAGTFDRTSGALTVFRRAMRRGLRELRLCDLFVAPDVASRSKMREVIQRLLLEHEVDLATARAVPRTMQAAVLLRSGFLPVQRIGPTLAIRPLAAGADLPPIERLSAWGASIGDLEVF
jgi:GNAT superfamily N-acetyltransferase